MKWSFASVGLIMLGLFGIIIIMLFNDITVSNEQDYYTLKYATEAAMIESVDAAYYRLTGKVKMSQEKFVENFTRRFTETSTFGEGNYNIEFFQIIEYPAKVSLRIVDRSGDYNIYTYTSDVDTTNTNIVNELSAILDTEQLEIVKNPINRPTPTPTAKPKPNYSYPQTPNVPYTPYTPRWPTYTPSYTPSGGTTYNTPSSSGNSGGSQPQGYYEVALPDGTKKYVSTLKEANKILTSESGLGTVKYHDGYGSSSKVGNGAGGKGGILTTSGNCIYCSSSNTSSSNSGGGSSNSGGGGGGGSSNNSGGGGKTIVVDSKGNKSNSCFLAGTKVVTINGLKDINKLKINDLVLTFNEGTGNNEYHRVTHLFAFEPNYNNESLITLTFDDQTSLKVSSTHRFYIFRNNEYIWLPANEIKDTDKVMYSNKTYHKIINTYSEKLTDFVYNISVENAHNFYVGEQNILVHNLSVTQIKLVK